jgi:hypothetical protein
VQTSRDGARELGEVDSEDLSWRIYLRSFIAHSFVRAIKRTHRYAIETGSVFLLFFPSSLSLSSHNLKI